MRQTIKSEFRCGAGYDAQHICKQCKYCIRCQCGSHAHYKCKRMGISSSTATDIRLKDIACTLFEGDIENENN